jgi:lipopolysaccharide exporter
MSHSPSHGERNFSKDVSKLASASMLAAVISIGVTPIITRLFTAEAFGSAAIFVSTATIIGIVACLRFELAILLPKEPVEAAFILKLCLLTTLVVTVVTAVGLGCYVLIPKESSLPVVYWLLPVAVLLQGANAAFIRWNARFRNFGRNSIARVSETTTTGAAQAGAGLANLTTAGSLVVGHLAGRLVSLLVLIKRDFRSILDQWKAGGPPTRTLIQRYRKFPLIDSISALTNTTSTHLPPLLLGIFFSPAAAGFYALGYRLIQLPMLMFGNAIAQVYFQRFAESSETKQRRQLTVEVFDRLVIIGLLPMATLALLGEEAFRLVFGAEWSEAGVYAEILSLWGFFWLISSPLSNVFSVLERQGLALRINFLIFGSRILSLAIGALMNDIRLAIVLFSISGAAVYLYFLLCIFFLTHVPAKHLLKTGLSKSIVVLPVMLLLVICQLADLPDIPLLVIATALVVIYFAAHYKKLIQLTVA